MFAKFPYLSLLLPLLFLAGCQDDEEVTQDQKQPLVSIEGYVQKGPFINGTAITASELSDQLVTTGKNFNTQIIDNKGSFSLKDIELASHYVQLQAQGFYFDEVRGEKSAAQLTLFALANVSNASSVNVNLLSHLEKDRVTYLMQEEDKTFEAAKQQAQQEILAIFGIEKTNMTASELLDISQDGEDNAILLAVSAILQANNSIAELSELLANLITDIREDGTLDSETTAGKLRTQAMGLDLPAIRKHLEARYEELGVSAIIPNFEQYIDSDGDGILNRDEDDTPDDFTFEAQVDVAIDTIVVSNEVTISGLKEGGKANIRVSRGQLILNGQLVADSTIQMQVSNGDKIQVVMQSSSEIATSTTAQVTLGSLVRTFEATTDDYSPNEFSFQAITNAQTETVYVSDTLTISGLPHPTPEGYVWFSREDPNYDGALYVNGQKYESNSGLRLKDGDQIWLEVASSEEYNDAQSVSLTINDKTADFVVTTDDYVPDEFSFTPVENTKRDSTYTSEVITLNGLLYPTAISLDRGTLIVNEEEVDGEVTVENGDQIKIALVAPSTFSQSATSTVQVGSLTKSFQLTTEQNPLTLIDNSVPEIGVDINGIYCNNSLYLLSRDSKFYQFDLSNKTWTRKADYPMGDTTIYLLYTTSFTIDNKIYIGLGYDDDNFRTVGRSFWMYDPQTDLWNEIAEFEGAERADARSLVVNNRAYVGLGDSGGQTKDFWKYNPETNDWNRLADFPGTYLRSSIAFVSEERAFAGSAYYTGGEIGGFDLWEYHLENDYWEKVSSNPYGESTENRVFTLYGKGYLMNHEHLSFYDLDNKIWRKSEYLPQEALYSFITVTGEDKIYIIHSGRSGKIYEFTPPQE